MHSDAIWVDLVYFCCHWVMWVNKCDTVAMPMHTYIHACAYPYICTYIAIYIYISYIASYVCT